MRYSMLILNLILLSVNSISSQSVSLYKTYQKYFPIGVAVMSDALKEHATDSLIKFHFKSLSPENEMKPEVIQPQMGKFDFSKGDSLVAYAQRNDMRLRGHCLVWHNQTPKWFFSDNGGVISKAKLYKRMKNHINNTMRHYAGKVYLWDVVNEAAGDEEGAVYREKNSSWYKICGKDYIVKAFQYAKKADPNALLFYNDYDTEQPLKRSHVFQLLKDAKAAGAPIDGIGLQAHWSIYEPSEKNLRETLDLFSSLGLKIQITELDISVYPIENIRRKLRDGEELQYTPELAQKQQEQYEMVFRVFRDYKHVITGVTLWGLTDKNTWLDTFPVAGRKNYPLLFDVDGNEKACFKSIVGF